MSARCAIWARVSKDEQESGNQLAQLRAEAARRGLEVTAEYVLDGLSAWTGAPGGTGAEQERPVSVNAQVKERAAGERACRPGLVLAGF